MRFVNRERELNALKESSEARGLNVVVIYGRRRIGKTALVREFMRRSERKALYFFVKRVSNQTLLDEFASILAEELGRPVGRFTAWEPLLEMAVRNFNVVIFDEVQNFYHVHSGFFSELQKVVDENPSEDCSVILTGSIVGLMYRIFQESREPLYGRVHRKINLGEMGVKDAFLLARELGADFREYLNLWCLFGGVPHYYALAEKYRCRTLRAVLEKLVLCDACALENEVLDTLVMEFGGQKSYYFSILQAISQGKCTLKEISDFTGIQTTTLPKYLEELRRDFGIVGVRRPIWGGRRTSHYFIRDPFTAFWFRFVYANYSLFEQGKYDIIRERVEAGWSAFAGRRMEDYVRELLVERYESVGSWWNRRGDEIDVVAVSDARGEVLFGEVKWQRRKAGYGVYEDLRRKSEMVSVPPGYRVKFLLVSRSGFKDVHRLKEEGVEMWTVEDLERMTVGIR